MPVIAVSQLNRNPETRADKRPQLSDLRESRARSSRTATSSCSSTATTRTRDPAQKGRADLIVAKHRNGPTDTIQLDVPAAPHAVPELRARLRRPRSRGGRIGCRGWPPRAEPAERRIRGSPGAATPHGPSRPSAVAGDDPRDPPPAREAVRAARPAQDAGTRSRSWSSPSSRRTRATSTATARSTSCAAATPRGRRSRPRRPSKVADAIRSGGLANMKAPRILAILREIADRQDGPHRPGVDARRPRRRRSATTCCRSPASGRRRRRASSRSRWSGRPCRSTPTSSASARRLGLPAATRSTPRRRTTSWRSWCRRSSASACTSG